MGAERKRPRGECVTFDHDVTDDGVVVPMTITATRAGACDADSTLECLPCAVPVQGGQTRWGWVFCTMCPVKTHANFKGVGGKTNQLCAKHARQMGTYRSDSPAPSALPAPRSEPHSMTRVGARTSFAASMASSPRRAVATASAPAPIVPVGARLRQATRGGLARSHCAARAPGARAHIQC